MTPTVLSRRRRDLPSLDDERSANKIDVIRRLLAKYSDKLTDRFVIVTETKVRFARP